MDKVPMTAVGYAAMMDEIKHLKTVERPKIIEQIEEARAHGDLSENAEYHAAKEKQGVLEDKIRELEDKIHRADLLQTSPADSAYIIFGAVVSVKDLSNSKVAEYTLVGPEDVDVASGKISSVSPIGKSLMGKKPGDVVEVRIPKGLIKLEILDYK